VRELGMNQITVEACASSANVGPGFDVFALALARPVDRVRISVSQSRAFHVTLQSSTRHLTTLPKKNVVGAVSAEIARDFGLSGRVKLMVEKKVPIGVGLGSSGASSAAAAFAMNEAFRLNMKKEELVYYAGKGELVASGAEHWDNVAASIYGGFVIVDAGKKPKPIMIPPPRNLRLVITTPVVRLPEEKTRFARSLLPSRVPLRSMVKAVSRASLVVAGFVSGDIGLIGKGLHDDIIERARQVLIPGYLDVKKDAIAAGASGVAISGAGPSVLALVDRRMAAPVKVLNSMIRSFAKKDVRAGGFITPVGDGARLVKAH
jgi:homoserine kinase